MGFLFPVDYFVPSAYNNVILRDISKNILKYFKGLLCIILTLSFSLFTLIPSSFAAETDDFVMYAGKKYDSSYFFAIEGEVAGQAAPGVQYVYVNAKPVKLNADRSFVAKVKLAEGQKYLVIDTKYQGLRFIKKYLVIRHPKVQKTFKIKIPEKEFKKIIQPKQPVAQKKPAPKKPAPKVVKKRPVKPPAKKAAKKPEVKLTPKTEAAAVPPTLFKEKPIKPREEKSAWQKFINWVMGFFPSKEVQVAQEPEKETFEEGEIIEAEPIVALEEDIRKIVEAESQKYLNKKLSKKDLQKIIAEAARDLIKKHFPEGVTRDILKSEARDILKAEAKRIVPDLVKKNAQDVIRKELSEEKIITALQKEAPIILEREIKKIIARDVPTGEGIKIAQREIRRLIKEEAPDYIEKEIQKIIAKDLPPGKVDKIIEARALYLVELHLKKKLDKDLFWDIALQAIQRDAMNAIDKDKLWEVAKTTVERESLKSMNKAALQKVAAQTVQKETAKLVKQQFAAIVKQQMQEAIAYQMYADQKARQITMPDVTTRDPRWPGYDLIVELEPGKILLVKRVNGKFYGQIYSQKENIWVALQEINYQELKDLLEKGKAPAQVHKAKG